MLCGQKEKEHYSIGLVHYLQSHVGKGLSVDSWHRIKVYIHWLLKRKFSEAKMYHKSVVILNTFAQRQPIRPTLRVYILRF